MPSDNQSGILWSFACLAILTLSGVLLANLVGWKHGSSEVRREFLDDIHDGTREIVNLRAELEELKGRHRDGVVGAGRSSIAVDAKGALGIELNGAIRELSESRGQLQDSIGSLREEFDGYRIRYRDQVRNNAVGATLDFLLLKSGRRFERVTITRVTPTGLEISHADGLARIDRDDLGREFMERFQWDDEERNYAIEARRDSKKQEEMIISRQTLPAAPPANPSGADFEKLRADVSRLSAKSIALRSSIRAAESNSRHATNRSVPGSLRTWAEQAALLREEQIRTDALLVLAREQLRNASPGTSALRPRPQ